MVYNLTCKDVQDNLVQFIDHKLTFELYNFIQQHLKNCPICKQKYEILKSIIFSLRTDYQNLKNDAYNKLGINFGFTVRDYEYFHKNLCVFIDNELEQQEKEKMLKYTQEHEFAALKVREIRYLQCLIKKSFLAKKRTLNQSFSDNIIIKIEDSPKSLLLLFNKLNANFTFGIAIIVFICFVIFLIKNNIPNELAIIFK